jgi:methyl-accepting chemotaxis protein
VAEEVRKLAEGVEAQASSIAEIIGDIQRETHRAVEAMSAGREDVSDGAARVTAAGEAFALIRKHVVQLSGEVGRVATAAQQLEAGAAQVQEQIGSVAAVSQENAAAAEEVAASTEETSASSEQVSAASRQLAAAAEQLAEMASAFRV